MQKEQAFTLDETELIDRILKGEKQLFRHLISHHKDMIFAMLVKQTGDFSLAEELAQETFIKAYTNLKSFRAEAKFSTWLIRIALNHSASYFASRHYKENQRTERFNLGIHEMSNNQMHEQQELKQQIAQFRRCLAKLTARFQQIVVLCGLEERSYQEAAEVMGVPVGTVRSRLNKARLLLKDCMTQA